MTDEENNQGVGGRESGVGEPDNSTTHPPQPTPSDLQAKCDEYLAGWKRALADYENLQKTNAQTRDTDRRRVRSNLADDLLPVVDNFGYVMKHAPSLEGCSDEFKKKFDIWFQGISHIDRQFTEALKNMGVEPIATVGQKFDPNLHESGGSKKDESQEDGVVLEELVRGWKIGDVVLRPAKVIVNELDKK